jgi:hypothetical protein
MRKSAIAVRITIAILLLAAVRTCVVFHRFGVVQRRFSSIQPLQSHDFVIAQLGKPNYHQGSCGVILAPLPNCNSELVYSHPLAPLMPEYYIVSFSSDDRVIGTNYTTSP